jgi:hypothetical protein
MSACMSDYTSTLKKHDSEESPQLEVVAVLWAWHRLQVVMAWTYSDGGMGVLLCHGSKGTVEMECCYGMAVR